MSSENTNFSQSVAGVVIKDGKGLEYTDYQANTKHAPYSLYSV